jgi:hypothetical protein
MTYAMGGEPILNTTFRQHQLVESSATKPY